MKKACFAGSFDPITNGHVDIIARAAALFDEVVVTISDNAEKKYMFTLDERIDFIEQAIKPFANVRVDVLNGLLIDYVERNGIDAIVRGVRGVSDFDYEYSLAQIYAETGGAETVMFPSRGKNAHISSSMVRELFKYGKDPAPYIPFKPNK